MTKKKSAEASAAFFCWRCCLFRRRTRETGISSKTGTETPESPRSADQHRRNACTIINCSKGTASKRRQSIARISPTLGKRRKLPGTTTSKPSDSFPGLMALVAGGTPGTVGAFYDVAYDRVLAPPRTPPATESPVAPVSRESRTVQPLNTKKATTSTRRSSTAAGPTA